MMSSSTHITTVMSYHCCLVAVCHSHMLTCLVLSVFTGRWLAWVGLMAHLVASFAGLALASPLPAAVVAQTLSVAFVALLLASGLLAGPLLAAMLAASIRLRSPASRLLSGLGLVCLALLGCARAEQWSTDLCVSPTGLGASGEGAPFTILGSAGSSVRRLRLYRNNGRDGYLRGLSVFFSDGTEMRGGVRKDQFADVELSDGEVITGMTLWRLDGGAANSSSSSSAPRVARLDLSTSERSWGFGVDNTERLTSKAVSVGSGVLVGFQGRAGDDLDFLAPVFLRPLSESTVSDIVFEKVGGDDGLRLVTLREGSAVYNGTDFSWSFSGSETRDTSTSFSSGFTNSLSVSTTFKSKIPAIAEAGISGSWSPGTSSSHDAHSGSAVTLSWSNTVALSKDSPAVSCSAMVWEGRLNVGWSGTQTISAGGATMSFATSGTLRHVAYGKVETVCRPMGAVARRWVA